MKKRIHPVRHVVMIAVLVVILFPLLWIFTTSIRRDNAAFSPELFSNQTTWQNYKDLLFPKKNIPALYNELVNVYNLGKPYNRMSQQEIQKLLNNDFRSYNNYFEETRTLSESISSNASWIIVNYLPKVKKLAVNDVRKNSIEDMTYVSTVDSYLSRKFNILPDNYKIAGLKAILSSVKKTPNIYSLNLIGSYFPDILKTHETFETTTKMASEKIRNIVREVSILLAAVNEPTARELVEAYQKTYNLLRNGTFTYSKWFAPIYLRGINLNTNRLSGIVSKNLFDKLRKIKNDTFGIIGKVHMAESNYNDALDNATLKVENVRNTLLVTLESSLTALNGRYTSLIAKLNTLNSNSLSYFSAMSNDASQISIFANSIVPTSRALEDTVLVIKDALKRFKPTASDTGLFIDVSSQLSSIKAWLSLSTKYPIFNTITKSVKRIMTNLEYIQSNESFIASHSNLDAIMNAKGALPLILLKLKSGLEQSLVALQNYDSLAQKYTENSEEIPKLKREISKISSQLTPIQNKINAILSRISLASLHFETEVAFKRLTDMQKKISTFESANMFLNTLNSYYAILQNSNFYSALPPMPKSSRYDRFYETQKLEDTMTLSIVTAKMMKEANNQYAVYLDTLKRRTPSYIEMKFLGVPFSISELNTISTFYHDQYVSKISPNLSIISRRTSDMMVKGYFGAINGRLNTINNSSFNLRQIWMIKYLPPFLRWMLNSVIVALSAAIITVFLSSLMAYPFSRMRFLGRKYGLMGILLIQMFPTMMAMVALYLLLNFIGKFFPPLGLNSLGGLAFLYIGGGIAFDTWLIKGFFDTIPTSLEEAAMVDGATRFQTFWRVVMPLSVPILAVVTILAFVGNFGDYILASIVMTSVNKYTLAVGLQTFSTSAYQTNWGLLTTAALLGAIPILVLFLSLQRFIVGGLTQGSVKG